MRITSKGQVTIPIDLRERFGLLPTTEVSIGFDRIEAVEAALPAGIFRREALPSEASFLAG